MAAILRAAVSCSLILCCLASVETAAASPADTFTSVDTNHDGLVDRIEFSALERNDKSGWLATLAGTTKAVADTTSAFAQATYSSFTMIMATEIGDRTFCIAAVMAMRYARVTIFAGAVGALVVMTILSTAIGVALPALLPKMYTHYAAAALFLYFGAKLLQEASAMTHGGGVAEEMAETEAELGITSDKAEADDDDDSKEVAGDVTKIVMGSVQAEGASATYDPESKSDSARIRSRGGGNASSSLSIASSGQAVAGGVGSIFSEWPIFSQAFTLTFLAEWGDRSQIATIALAAAQNPYGVALGGFVGHSLCTGVAVVGGRMLASRISERAVAIGGGVLFLLFGVHALLMGPGE